MNTKLKDKLYNITFVLHDLTNKPIRNLPYEIKNGKKLVKKGITNVQGEITLKYIGGNTLTVFVHKDIDQTMKKIGEIHTPSKNIKVKLISPKMKFDVTLLPHDTQGKYWRGTYKVKNGDTLSKIAKQHHTTVSALLALNPQIKSPDKIYLNEKIDIIEGNEDAILKLDENTTIRIPPTKSTGTVAIDRKNKSVGMNSSTHNAKNKTVDQKIEQSKPKVIEPKDKQPVTSSPRIATQTNAPMRPSSQKIEVQQEHNENKKPIAVASLNGCVCKDYDLIWGAKVNCAFRKKVVEISKELWGEVKKIEKANMLMAVFAWESGGTFAVDVPNINNSGATGLIQIMPETYTSLTKKKPTLTRTSKYYGKSLTHIKELARMTQIQYLDLVKQYFLPLKGKDFSFIDLYLQVLFPASAGREEHTVFAKNKELLDVRDHMDKRVDKFANNNMDGWYLDASGKLHKDGKKDGKVMKSEIAAAVEHYQTDGLSYKSDYKEHKGSITATSTTQVTDYQKSEQQGAAEKSECKDGCSIKLNHMVSKHRCISGMVKDGFIVDEMIKIYKVPSYNRLPISRVKAIVLHRTAGAPNVKNYLDSRMKNNSTVGVQFWIGKDGVIYQAGGLDKLSHHIDVAPLKNPKIPNLWSKYAIGIEVSGYYYNPNGEKVVGNIRTDPNGRWEDVSDAQAKSVACLINYLLKYFNFTLANVTVHEQQCSKTHHEGQNVYDAMLPYLNTHG